MTNLKLTQEALQRLTKSATTTFPSECCGFLFGVHGAERLVTEVQLVGSSEAEEPLNGFKLNEKDFQAATQYARANDLEILGLFQSRVGAVAIPSHLELYGAVPFLSYLFLSVQSKVVDAVTSWQLDLEHEEFYEEKVEISEDALVAA